VAGTLGGTTWGVAKGVTLHAVRVLNCEGSGTWEQVIAGVDWVTANHVKPAVANMSLGGWKMQALEDAVTASIQAGVVYVVAAGNDNMDACSASPAGTPLALTVGATEDTDERAYFSNFGPCVDLFAPGAGITSAWNTGDTDTRVLSGTSMASPHVAGVAALYLQEHPTATPQAVAAALLARGTPGQVSGPGAGSPNLLLFNGCASTGDTTPPQVTLTAPGAGTVSGQVTLTAQASDDTGVDGVSFFLDGRAIGFDRSAPFEVTWNSAEAFSGPAVLTARAVDAGCNLAESAPVTVLIDSPGQADFDAALGVPVCASVLSECDSGNLLFGRGTVGPERNQPNTLGGTCTDGSAGAYQLDTSLERLRLFTENGSPFAPGKRVRVEASLKRSFNQSGHILEIFHAPDANAPTWTRIAWIDPFYENEQGPLGTSFILPAGSLQALRGAYRQYGEEACLQHEYSQYDDYDDVAFAVGTETDEQPPSIALISPADGETLSGGTGFNVTATDNFAVTRVEFFANGTLISTRTEPPFESYWDSRTVPNGTYTLTARAWDLAGFSTTSAPVTVHLNNDYTPPTVSFIAPSDGATIADYFPLQATASDEDGHPGDVWSVRYSVDGTLIGSKGPPFIQYWDTRKVPNGTHVLTATAYDYDNNASTTTVTIQVNNDVTPPTVTITSPTQGANVLETAQVTASASDDRSVKRVEFFVGNTRLNTDSTAPYSFTWSTRSLPNGSTQTLTAKAYDAYNQVGTHSITVVVDHDVTAPVVSITSPTADSRVSGTLQVSAEASDNRGVTRVDFYAGTSLIGSDTTAPYSTSWYTRSSADGAHTLTVKAYDALNNVGTTSATYTVDNTKPTVAFTSAQPALVRGLLPLQVSVQDASPVVRVEFLVDWHHVHITPTEPYATAWDSSTWADGTRRISAMAYDALGNSGYTEFMVVVDNTPPAVSLTSPAAGAVLRGSTTLTANASDSHSVARVEFYAGSLLVGTDTSAPYSVTWTPASRGSFTLTAKAYDSAGNVTTSVGVPVQVK
jgi:hypothetical protein